MSNVVTLTSPPTATGTGNASDCARALSASRWKSKQLSTPPLLKPLLRENANRTLLTQQQALCGTAVSKQCDAIQRNGAYCLMIDPTIKTFSCWYTCAPLERRYSGCTDDTAKELGFAPLTECVDFRLQATKTTHVRIQEP